MTIATKDRKILWAKAGNRCSYRHENMICDEELIVKDENEYILVGEECHIVGKKLTSARYIDDFPDKDSYDNLILMCRKHHKIIDDNEDIYGIELLKEMKKNHEESMTIRIKNKEIDRIIIKDSYFKMDVKDAEEAIGMEVNKPALISNVRSELRVNNVRKATGFSTNQQLTSIIMTCSYCHRTFPFVTTGPQPLTVLCPFCKGENKTNIK